MSSDPVFDIRDITKVYRTGDVEVHALRGARSHATKTYTACGSDTDWLAQAEHFASAAAAA